MEIQWRMLSVKLNGKVLKPGWKNNLKPKTFLYGEVGFHFLVTEI
jgi:hypothetical protein